MVLHNIFFSIWPTFVDLVLLMFIGHGRQYNAAKITLWICQSILNTQCGAQVVLTLKTACDVAGPYAHHQHHWRVRGFGQLKTLFDRRNDRGQIWPWINQPELRFHGKGMAAFLHDRRSLAVIFADDDQSPTIHAA